MNSKLSVVIPAYNEEATITKVIEGLLASTKTPVEIIVVDDASTDQTAKVLAPLVEAGKLRLVRHSKNRGYGACLKSGIHAAQGEWIAILDGDGTYPTDRLDEFLALTDHAEMVVGSRSGQVVVEPWLRSLVKRFIRFLLRWLARIEVPDLNSGLRLFRKSTAQKYLHLLPDGLSFTATITLVMLSEGYPVEFLPINYFPRRGSKSKFHPIYDTGNLLVLLLRTLLYFNPLKVFVPLSIFMVALALAIAFFSIFVLGKFMDVTTVVMLVASVQVFITGLLADLITKLKR
jgi:glycosyltransferase involved in cell wall biosynthesis